MAEPDLSKIVSMIMNNPTLVEEIRDMVAKSDAEEEEKNEEGENEVIASAPKKAEETSAKAITEDTYREKKVTRRNELLRAMRPYLSEERGRAIESMITVMDIVLALKEK